MTLYDELADVSLELLTEYGQDITRISYTAGTYSTSTSSAAPTTASTTRKGAIFSLTAGTTHKNGTLIQVGDKQLLVDAEGDIDITDHFTVDSVQYVIAGMDEVSPAGTVVLYDLHVRVG